MEPERLPPSEFRRRGWPKVVLWIAALLLVAVGVPAWWLSPRITERAAAPRLWLVGHAGGEPHTMEIDFLASAVEGAVETESILSPGGTVSLEIPGLFLAPSSSVEGLVARGSGEYEAPALVGDQFRAVLTREGKLTGEWWIPLIGSEEHPPPPILKSLDFDVIARARMLVGKGGVRILGRGRTAVYRGVYPEFVNPTPLDRAAQTWARDTMHESARAFTKVYDDLEDAWATFQEVGTSSNAWVCDETCHVRFRSDRIVSLLCTTYTYSGGVHGNFATVGGNFYFDGRDAARIELSDLFRSDSGWETELIARLAEEDRRRATFDNSGDRIKGMSLDTISSWTLERDGIHFLFDPYVIGPFAIGTQEISLSYDPVRDLLRETGPAAALPR